MQTESFLVQAVVYLAAATISVPIAKRAGLGSVLGYLLSGVLIGPFVLGFVGQEHKDVMHFAEFGVVMMLFLIGLELQPKVLWQMRKQIFAFGGLQVLLSSLVLAGFAYAALADGVRDAVAIGMTLSLSSTAIALQTMHEKNLMNTPVGQQGFAVLLLQDLAVIPMLAVLPLLAVSGLASGQAQSSSVLSSLHPALQTIVIILTLAGFIVVAKFLVRPVFRFIAETRLREIFTAFALMLVIGTAVLMTQLGLSAALGTFLAGVVLADSEYRHELESVVEPFKGLLLGIFFIAVGASIDFNVITASPVKLFLTVGIVVGCKMAVLYGLAQKFGMQSRDGVLMGALLSQGSEFAFVLLGFAQSSRVMSRELADFMVAVVTLSMLSTPLLLISYNFFLTRFSERSRQGDPSDSESFGKIERKGRVIVCGYGRFGQIVSRLLFLNGVETVLLDHSPKQIDRVSRFGIKVFYGDATRGDLLESAGIGNADILVVAVDDPEQAISIVENCKHNHPHVKVLARAHDRNHAFELMRARADGVFRETFSSAVDMGVEALSGLGVHPHQAYRLGRQFARHDEMALRELLDAWKGEDPDYIAKARQKTEDITNIIRGDRVREEVSVDHAFDGPPRRAT